MISEFQDLSDKIDRLAALTQALRSENAVLRQANTTLLIENRSIKGLLERAQVRLLELLAKLPPEDANAPTAVWPALQAGSAPAHPPAALNPAAQPDESAQ